MAYHTKMYEAFVFLGKPKIAPLWHWKVWTKLAASLDALIQAARGKTAVRVGQLAGEVGEMKPVSFGRLGWQEADHQKWCHGSPANKSDSKSWEFQNLELWAPAWTICEREELAPDLFLGMANEAMTGIREKMSFNPVVIFAVAAELAGKRPAEVNAAVSTLQELTGAKLAGWQLRQWGKEQGSGFTDAIQDLPVTGLFKPGKRHEAEIGYELFRENWKPIPAVNKKR